jgi:hypothetical protein
MKELKEDSLVLRRPVVLLFWFACIVLLGNLLLVLFGSITNYDSLTCHLARVKYYLQFGKVWYYGANYWAQDIHPTNLTYIHIIFYSLTGHWENSFLLVQYFSLVLISFFLYKIALAVYRSKPIARLSALLVFLFVNPVVQSATSQNDLFLTLLFSIQIYFCVGNHSRIQKAIFLFAVCLFGLGVKQTFVLYQPGILLIYYFFNRKSAGVESIPNRLIMYIPLLVSPLFLSYMVSNYINLGSINGFDDVMKHHSFLDKGIVFVLKSGTRNLLRYFFDFITLDGLNSYPPLSFFVAKVNNFFKFNINHVLSFFVDNLEKGPEIRLGFFCLKPLSVEDSSSFWGPIGPLLVLPSMGYFFFKSIRARSFSKETIFAIALVVCVLAQAYSSYYDMWRGRYFNELVPLACLILGPFVAIHFNSNKTKYYITSILILSALATFGATYLRRDRTILFNKLAHSIFTSSRDELITQGNTDFLRIMHYLDGLNPKCDSIGVYTTENMPEYLFFRKEENRKFFPLNSHQMKSPWLGYRMDAILFTNIVLKPESEDVQLGVFGVNGEILYYRENQIR